MFKIHWNGAKDFTTELDNECLNDSDSNHDDWEFFVFANVFKDIKACATGVERVEDDGVNEYRKGEGCHHFKVTCPIGDKVLNTTDVFKKRKADKSDKDAGCTNSGFHV